MDQFIQFVYAHWLLWLGVVTVLALLLTDQTQGSISGIKQCTPQQAVALMNDQSAIVIDIRNENAFATAHIKKAVHASVLDMKKILGDDVDTSKPLLFYGVKSHDALAAAFRAKKQGFANCFYLLGGIQAWKEEHLPVVVGDSTT